MGRVLRKARELQHAWNIHDKPPRESSMGGGMTQPPRSGRGPARYYSDRSFVGSIYNRLAVDFSQVEFFHAKLHESDDVAVEIVRDPLHHCLTLDANVDQSAQALKIDFAMTLFEQGHACIVPTDASMDPMDGPSYDIKALRVATVAAWFPRHVLLNVYDDREVDEDGEPVNGGVTKQVRVPKEWVCIVENPFYSVMNEPNGLVQRYLRKLEMLDSVDEAARGGDLDLITQRPYNPRHESRQAQAEKRRDALRNQLKDDELGIGYIDVSEKIIQLNRPIENKLLEQIQYLADGIMAELGLTKAIMDGSATQDQVNAYYDRTINPVAEGLRQEEKRKFLTKTAITQRHSIETYRDPLKLIPASELADLVDSLRRNGVITSNELRPKIGYMPSKDATANELGNPNMPVDKQLAAGPKPPAPTRITAEQVIPALPAKKGGD